MIHEIYSAPDEWENEADPGFGIYVDWEDADEWNGPGYTVSLPHQCGPWGIAYPPDGGPADGKTAVNRMRAFVRQAEEALRALELHVASSTTSSEETT